MAISKLTDDSAELRRLYIAKHERHKGFGRKLINYSLNYCRNTGIKKVIGYTTIRNKEAISLARKRGFQLVNIERESISGDIQL